MPWLRPPLLIVLLLASGCTPSRPPETPPSPVPPIQDEVREAAPGQRVVTGLIEVGDHLRLILDQDSDLPPGTQVRICDSLASARQIGLGILVLGPEGRTQVRLTGLFDRTRPVKAGDLVLLGEPLPITDPPPPVPAAATAAPVAAPPPESATVVPPQADAELERLRQELAELRRELDQRSAEAAGQAKQAEIFRAEAQELRQRLAALAAPPPTSQPQTLAAELGRLQAEQALFELSAQVLRLPAKLPEVAALQERLKGRLEARADLNQELQPAASASAALPAEGGSHAH